MYLLNTLISRVLWLFSAVSMKDPVVQKKQTIADQMIFVNVVCKFKPQDCSCDTRALHLSAYWCCRSLYFLDLLDVFRICLSGCLLLHFRFNEINRRKQVLWNTRFNRCFLCCKWQRREKQFDLLSLSLKSAYLNLIFYLSLLVVKSECRIQLRDYKHNKEIKITKQDSGKSWNTIIKLTWNTCL